VTLADQTAEHPEWKQAFEDHYDYRDDRGL